VDEPPARGAHLDQPELVHVARDRRLHDLVTFAAKRVRELRLRREGLLADEPENRGVPLVAVHAFNTSVRISRARSTSAAPTTSGGSRSCRSEEHTSELQSRSDLVCRLLLEKK